MCADSDTTLGYRIHNLRSAVRGEGLHRGLGVLGQGKVPFCYLRAHCCLGGGDLVSVCVLGSDGDTIFCGPATWHGKSSASMLLIPEATALCLPTASFPLTPVPLLSAQEMCAPPVLLWGGGGTPSLLLGPGISSLWETGASPTSRLGHTRRCHRTEFERPG